jgi:cyclic beta-1,2-glucan synthetase
VGRGGWTWYTGAAGWMYRAGIEGILGIHREGEFLVIDPCFPPGWPGYEARVKVGGTCYDIQVDSPSNRGRGIARATLDGRDHALSAGRVRVSLDGASHRLQVVI